MHLFRCIFLFFRTFIRFKQLKGFEYRVFYGSWKNSRLMGFELSLFEINFVIMYNIIKIIYLTLQLTVML